MNSYVKSFLHRGLVFGGFGPCVVGIIFACISAAGVEVILEGGEICLAILSSYLLAFVHAGASVFNQIESWSIPKSVFFHFVTLYAAYTGCYLTNSWLDFEPMALLVFTAVFVIIYFVIWLSVYLSVKGVSRKLNEKIK